MKKKLLVKVTLQYDNGLIQSLKGKDANDWLEGINAVLIMHQVRGYKINVPQDWDTEETGE